MATTGILAISNFQITLSQISTALHSAEWIEREGAEPVPWLVEIQPGLHLWGPPFSHNKQMTSITTALLGVTAHAAAVLSKLLIGIPDQISNPKATQYLGLFTWLTVQTNVICCLRFAAVLVAHFTVSSALETLTVRLFPLSFGLGSMLTLLFYSLDYFQEENVQKRKKYSQTVAPYCELAAHIEHGSALPLALMDALTLGASRHSRPGVVDLVGGYILFYMGLTLFNHAATSVWQYPIIADAQRAAGWPGVLLFFAAIAGLMISAGLLGVAIVGFQ